MMKIRLLNHRYGAVLLFLFIALSSASCSDDNEARVYDPSRPVVIEEYMPNGGGVGTKLIIKGQNFGTDPSLIKVIIKNDENREAKVVNCTDTRIYAIVPARAGTGEISVTVGMEENSQTVVADRIFEYEFRQNVSTVAGGSSLDELRDGSFAEALFRNPMWLEIDSEGYLYVQENEDIKALRILNLGAETVTTPWVGLSLNRPMGIVFDSTRDTLFVSVEGGNGTSASATSGAYLLRSENFSRDKIICRRGGSNGLCVNPVTNEIFTNCYYNGEIYRWDRKQKTAVLAANISRQSIDFTFCWSLDGKTLFYIIRNSGYIGKFTYDLATGVLSDNELFAGSWDIGFADGLDSDARFNAPNQMVAGPDGDYFVADRGNHCIRRITALGQVSTYAGMPGQSGFTEGDPLTEAMFKNPTGLAISDDGSTLYVADSGNKRICKILVE